MVKPKFEVLSLLMREHSFPLWTNLLERSLIFFKLLPFHVLLFFNTQEISLEWLLIGLLSPVPS